MTYRIKPLEWYVCVATRRSQADTPFGECVVRRIVNMTWEYYTCFDRYWQPCDSLQHGKQLAQSHYERRLMAALEPVEEQ